jgi:arylsulfatase A-like enzyme
MTGQYASRHGIIDNVARGAMSHRLPNYHLELQQLGYETAHIGKWHMGNDGMPRPGYDYWVSYDGHGRIVDPRLNHDGKYVEHSGYITDIMNDLAVQWLEKKQRKDKDAPWSLFFAHKAVHPDAEQAADGTVVFGKLGGYIVAERHKDLYKDAVFPKKPNMLSYEEVVKQKPAWKETFLLRAKPESRQLLDAIHAGTQEEIRLRARMMAAVDEGVGRILAVLEKTGELDNTLILFLGDNGYFFGEHGLGPERRFAYEEGIRSPFVVRFPKQVKAGTKIKDLVICQDIAPTLIELGGGKPGPQIQGKSLVKLFGNKKAAWRKAVLAEYWAEQAYPWLIGMTYKAIRTPRYKLIHWVNRDRDRELDELYDLDKDPFELRNLIKSKSHAAIREKLRRDLKKLVAEAVGI